VKEDRDNSTKEEEGSGEKYNHSLAEYTVTVYVANTEATGTGTGLYISDIGVTKTTDESGNTVNSKIGVNKSGQTDSKDDSSSAGDNGGDSGNSGSTTGGIGNKFLFVNTYIKEIDPTGNSPLTVKLNTAGNVADRTKEFPVNITVTKTALETGTPSYTVVVKDNSGALKTSNGNDTLTDGKVTLTSGTEATIYLKNGESFEVQGLLIGTGFTVNDANTDTNYTVSAESDVSEQISIASDTKIVSGKLTQKTALTFTNTYEKMLDTGIIINNLPFLLLIIVAVLGIVYFAVSRKRREQV
jgi:hypothetical protein